LPRSVGEFNFNVSEQGAELQITSPGGFKINYSLSLHMPFVNPGLYIYVKMLNEKNTVPQPS